MLLTMLASARPVGDDVVLRYNSELDVAEILEDKTWKASWQSKTVGGTEKFNNSDTTED